MKRLTPEEILRYTLQCYLLYRVRGKTVKQQQRLLTDESWRILVGMLEYVQSRKTLPNSGVVFAPASVSIRLAAKQYGWSFGFKGKTRSWTEALFYDNNFSKRLQPLWSDLQEQRFTRDSLRDALAPCIVETLVRNFGEDVLTFEKIGAVLVGYDGSGDFLIGIRDDPTIIAALATAETTPTWRANELKKVVAPLRCTPYPHTGLLRWLQKRLPESVVAVLHNEPAIFARLAQAAILGLSTGTGGRFYGLGHADVATLKTGNGTKLVLHVNVTAAAEEIDRCCNALETLLKHCSPDEVLLTSAADFRALEDALANANTTDKQLCNQNITVAGPDAILGVISFMPNVCSQFGLLNTSEVVIARGVEKHVIRRTLARHMHTVSFGINHPSTVPALLSTSAGHRIVGPNGSGKTMALIGLLEHDEEGLIVFIDPLRYSRAALTLIDDWLQDVPADVRVVIDDLHLLTDEDIAHLQRWFADHLSNPSLNGSVRLYVSYESSSVPRLTASGAEERFVALGIPSVLLRSTSEFLDRLTQRYAHILELSTTVEEQAALARIATRAGGQPAALLEVLRGAKENGVTSIITAHAIPSRSWTEQYAHLWGRPWVGPLLHVLSTCVLGGHISPTQTLIEQVMNAAYAARPGEVICALNELRMMGLVHQHSGEVSADIPAFVELDSKPPDAAGELDRIINSLQGVTLTPEVRGFARDLCEHLLSRGEIRRAVRLSSYISSRWPHWASGISVRIRALVAANQSARAFELVEQVLAITPAEFVLWSDLAGALAKDAANDVQTRLATQRYLENVFAQQLRSGELPKSMQLWAPTPKMLAEIVQQCSPPAGAWPWVLQSLLFTAFHCGDFASARTYAAELTRRGVLTTVDLTKCVAHVADPMEITLLSYACMTQIPLAVRRRWVAEQPDDQGLSCIAIGQIYREEQRHHLAAVAFQSLLNHQRTLASRFTPIHGAIVQAWLTLGQFHWAFETLNGIAIGGNVSARDLLILAVMAIIVGDLSRAEVLIAKFNERPQQEFSAPFRALESCLHCEYGDTRQAEEAIAACTLEDPENVALQLLRLRIQLEACQLNEASTTLRNLLNLRIPRVFLPSLLLAAAELNEFPAVFALCSALGADLRSVDPEIRREIESLALEGDRAAYVALQQHWPPQVPR